MHSRHNPAVTEMLAQFDRLIRRDPAHRGLISSEARFGPLCAGDLERAVRSLSRDGKRAIVATGFFIPSAATPAAETDGPPGAMILAFILKSLGITTTIATDRLCFNAVAVAAEAADLSHECVVALPNTKQAVDDWLDLELKSSNTPPLTHLISVERVGPSHTIDSIRSQLKRPTQDCVSHESILAEFDQLVPIEERNRCYNMRGACIDEHTAPLHRLFERARENRGIKTIGIGDGGNEIGMGKVAWSELKQRLQAPVAARIPCRIETDWNIIAGVSNWGAMALAAGVLAARGISEFPIGFSSENQQEQLRQLVAKGPAVDGITRLPEATVDGLPFLTYIQPWEGIMRELHRRPRRHL